MIGDAYKVSKCIVLSTFVIAGCMHVDVNNFVQSHMLTDQTKS